ncbi:MAG TPA: hypothetical protein VHE54_17965 [Puia sp.]|nr:hypothetical protein [Puia sp.]
MRAILSAFKRICLVPVMVTGVVALHAQTTILENSTYDPNHPSAVLPTFFAHDSAKGSPYLAKGWMRGVLELSDHRRVPHRDQAIFFNYDKMNERLFATDGIGKQWTYPMDSVCSFTLADTTAIYNFEKVPLISGHHFLEVLVRSPRGYGLFRRVITKIAAADYRDLGYLATGRRFDTYVDSYQYYLLYPGGSSFRKLNLKVRDVKKALRSESARVNPFFGPTGGDVDPKALVLLVRYLNEEDGY